MESRAALQPFRMLVEHGIYNVNEGFVTGEESVAAREQVAFEPALAHVLADTSITRPSGET